MMGDAFETLEEDFKELCDLMRRKIDGRLINAQGEERKKLCRELEKSSSDAQAVLTSLEAELQRAPAYERSTMRNKLTAHKRSLESINSRIQQVTHGSSDLDDMEAAHRAKLMQGTRSLQRASESVHRSRQIASETDEIGVNIIGELDRQGEVLEGTRDRLYETQGALDKSRNILRGMAVRVFTNKIIMVVIIIVELAILAGVVYLRFFRPK
ncbi:vesicle transport through interaction with t-SNAREs homolog 1B-like [Watersipora subatra]|uniref:vesicle transport through interaction with t-SNAREs homolog 1B-like n=1 Tax=Watersipora subatra TaxID=2589382 RepID=UPI00355C7630